MVQSASGDLDADLRGLAFARVPHRGTQLQMQRNQARNWEGSGGGGVGGNFCEVVCAGVEGMRMLVPGGIEACWVCEVQLGSFWEWPYRDYSQVGLPGRRILRVQERMGRSYLEEEMYSPVGHWALV